MYAEYFAGDQHEDPELALSFEAEDDTEEYSAFISDAWAEWDEKEHGWKVPVRSEGTQQAAAASRSKA